MESRVTREDFFIYQLISAIKNNNVDDIKFWLDEIKAKNISIDTIFLFDETKNELTNARAFDGETALYSAVKAGNPEIVQLLLENGANPNLITESVQSATLLSTAIHDHSATIAELLINAGAHTQDKTLIKEMSQLSPETKSLLQQLGINKRYDQYTLEKNYNLFVELLHKNNIITLKRMGFGLCDGLSKLFIFYEKQERSEEFKYFLTCITALTPETMQTLIEKHLANKKNGVSVKKSKLITFVEAVNKTQESQTTTNYKSIGANWESTHIICCSKDKLIDYLERSRVLEKETGKYKIIRTSNHATAISIHDDEKTTFYEPNAKYGPDLHENAKSLADTLLSTTLSKHKTVSLYIDTLSYDISLNQDFADLLNNTIITNHANMQAIILRYKKGELSRRDTAAILYFQSLQLEKTTLVIEVQRSLKTYLDTAQINSVQNVIENSSVIINTRNTDRQHTPFFDASMRGCFEIVQTLLHLGADPNIDNTWGILPITMALAYEHKEISQVIKQHESVKAVLIESEKKNRDDMPFAEKLSHLFDAYAHPPLFSFYWRSHRTLAANIAKVLKKHPHWTQAQCKNHITDAIQNVQMNYFGTFKGLLDEVSNQIKTTEALAITKQLT